MPALQTMLMTRLHGRDLWAGYVPPTRGVDLQGWNCAHPALPRLAACVDAPVAIDVGVWKGVSAINMALAMKTAGLDGCVIAVDTFLGSAEHWQPGAELFDRWHGRPDLYERFLCNVWNLGVADYIVPLPQTSATAAAILARVGIAATLIHIDAAHGYADVMSDSTAYWPLLVPGGHLIGDDYVTAWPEVRRAAHDFAARTGCALDIEAPKWIVGKPAGPGLPDAARMAAAGSWGTSVAVRCPALRTPRPVE